MARSLPGGQSALTREPVQSFEAEHVERLLQRSSTSEAPWPCSVPRPLVNTGPGSPVFASLIGPKATNSRPLPQRCQSRWDGRSRSSGRSRSNDGVAVRLVCETQDQVAPYVRNCCPVGESRHILEFVVLDNADVNWKSAATIVGVTRARTSARLMDEPPLWWLLRLAREDGKAVRIPPSAAVSRGH
jgi:hypothetical protein